MEIFKIENYVHENLGISDKRNSELEELTKEIGCIVENESEFLLKLEKTELSLREKLYVAAQFGRLYRKEKEE